MGFNLEKLVGGGQGGGLGVGVATILEVSAGVKTVVVVEFICIEKLLTDREGVIN